MKLPNLWLTTLKKKHKNNNNKASYKLFGFISKLTCQNFEASWLKLKGLLILDLLNEIKVQFTRLKF